MSPGTEIEPVSRVPDPVWRRMLAEPERAPELMALAAAERFAAPVERWIEMAGQGHTPDSLAKEAVRKHVRMSRLEGLALGVGGVVTSAANLAGLAWIEARMVFFVAGAYGYEPRHPMRPAELLALWGVYPTPAEARASLDGIGKTMAQTVIESKLSGERRLTQKLVKYVGKRLVKRAGGRLVPLLGAPISAVQNAGSTKDLGREAIVYYGGGSD